MYKYLPAKVEKKFQFCEFSGRKSVVFFGKLRVNEYLCNRSIKNLSNDAEE
jgi:hypothetical protein